MRKNFKTRHFFQGPPTYDTTSGLRGCQKTTSKKSHETTREGEDTILPQAMARKTKTKKVRKKTITIYPSKKSRSELEDLEI